MFVSITPDRRDWSGLAPDPSRVQFGFPAKNGHFTCVERCGVADECTQF